MDRMTDTCEKITFRQVRWQAVIIKMCFHYASALASIPTSEVTQGKMLGIGMEPIHRFLHWR